MWQQLRSKYHGSCRTCLETNLFLTSDDNHLLSLRSHTDWADIISWDLQDEDKLMLKEFVDHVPQTPLQPVLNNRISDYVQPEQLSSSSCCHPVFISYSWESPWPSVQNKSNSMSRRHLSSRAALLQIAQEILNLWCVPATSNTDYIENSEARSSCIIKTHANSYFKIP